MAKHLLILAATCGLWASSAQAATLDITLGSTIDYTYNASQAPDPSNINIGPHTPGLDLVDNSVILPKNFSLPNYWAAPTGITGHDYIAVLGLTPNRSNENEGEATLTLAPGNDHLGLTWGTIDAYNTLTITDSKNTYTITGADILSHLVDAIAGTTQVNVEITDPAGNILNAKFASTGNSFEFGNLSEMDTPAPAPLPPSLVLFGTVLAGLFIWARRKAVKA